jgi:natural product biosynthesis luciferase-like monooxygenase protein/amino acid adenylation domain-containing protein
MPEKDWEHCADAIAVVGIAGRFPRASDLAAFWQNLWDGKDGISFFSEEELLAAGVDRALLADPAFVRGRAVLENPGFFDATFFGFNPREAEITNPQHRLFLECCWQALEDAGYDPGPYPGAIGVFASASMNSYLLRVYSHPQLLHQVGGYRAQIANDREFLPTWVSYKLDLKGPSVNVQTACSSSLVALHMACQSLLNGECDMALAGGVSVRGLAPSGYLYQEGGILSPDGYCRAFDAAAAGTVDGDGVGVVVLKRLDDALADRDNIQAVVLGSAINNDGSSKAGYTAPSLKGQTRVISEALSIADVDPGTVTYIEAHGTGTRLGDPVEISALTDAFRSRTKAAGFCALGSVKTNIGHLDAAAGVAGLIKAVLALRNRRLPPSLHFRRPNPEIDFTKTPFYVNAEPVEWPANGHPRRAGVSSFGIGGTNVHVVLEEAPPLESGPSREWQLLTWSARTETALEAATADLARFLIQTEESLADIAHTLSARRPFAYRRALACRDVREAATLLERPGSSLQEAQKRRVAFLFPGQGAQRVGMTCNLYQSEPVFRAEVDRCAELLLPALGGDLREVLYPTASGDEAEQKLLSTAWAQPALFVVEWSLAQLWISWGIEPGALLGHSVGEYVAACVAGALDLKDALSLIAARGRLMQNLPLGGMLAVPLGEDDIQPLLGDALSLAAVNGPQRTVVSGPLPEIENLMQRLAAQGIEGRRLKTSHAFHSRMMEPILAAFAEKVREVTRKTPRIPYLSNVTGDWISPQEVMDVAAWVHQLRAPVRFGDALARLLQDPDYVLLEVGPGQTLTGLVYQHPDFKAKSHLAISSLRSPGHSESEPASLMDALGRLWVAGVEVDRVVLTRGERRRRVSLPTYPFERQKYWIESHRPDAAKNNEENRMPEAAATVTPEDLRHEVILDGLKEIVRDLTGVTPSAVNPQASFLEAGVDSLLLIQATQRLQERFGVRLSLIQLLEDLTTLDSVATYLARELPEAWFSVPGQTPNPPALAPVATASPAPPVVASPAPVLSARAEPLIPAQIPRPAAAGVASTSALERIVAQQLQLMASQLQLLQGAPAGDPLPAAPAHLPMLETRSPEPPPAAPIAPEPYTRFGPYHPIEAGPQGGLTPRQQDYLDAFIRRYNARTAKSKQMTQEYRPVLADSRASVGFRRMWKELIYPIHGERAQGSRIWDLDGNEYVDINMGFGLHFFGHSPDFVLEAMERQMRTGLALGPQSPLAGRAAKLICELTGMERAVFCNSGTEAVMGALRAARTFTRRSKVALFSQSYHGWADATLARPQTVDSRRVSVPAAPGVPDGTLADVLILDYTSPKALEDLERHATELAAVIVEPVRSRSPEVQPREFLRQVRELTARHGILLIFDEMVTGFRVHPGGAQAFFGIEADLATYGKLIAAGLPIGVVAGRSRFMDVLDGGMWSFNDPSYPTAEKTMMAGAFFKHPLTMAASCAVLERMQQEGPALQERLNARTARLVADLNADFATAGVPIEMVCFGSLFRFRPSRELQYADLFFYHLVEKGIFYTMESGNCFLTTAHTEEDLEHLRSAVHQSVVELQEAGFLPGPPSGLPPRERRDTTVRTTATPSPNADPAVDTSRNVELSLYYFGSYAAAYDPSKYELLIAGARFADEHGFSGIWLPERHFHPFGGFSPNPAVLAASLARETKRLHLRAGSAVVPLQHPVRLAEDWALVDNLSQGRAGVSFASGWHSNDFVLAPQAYERRHEIMYEGIEKVRALWRGEPLRVRDGTGTEMDVYLHPLPRQKEIPIWLTAASPYTYIRAGEMGCGVLTNLQSQSIEDLGKKLALYREALVRHDHGLAAARVTLLLHTYVGPDLQRVREKAAGPLRNYLRSSLQLTRRLLASAGHDIDLDHLPEGDLDYLLGMAAQHYMADNALIGDPETCAATIERMQRLGVTEIGCLIDFGLDTPSVLEGLTWLERVQHKTERRPAGARSEAPAVEELPLSEPHRALWIACSRSPEASQAYNEPIALRLHGLFDAAAMRSALQGVVDRHGALRSTFSRDGTRQRISSSLAVEIPITDLSGLDDREREREALAWLARQAAEPFDLELGPLIRCAVARLGGGDHYLSLTVHHLVIDGHSGGVMLRDLCALYAAGRRNEPAPLGKAASLREYVHREDAELRGVELAKAEAYWAEMLSDAPPRLELPSDHSPSRALSYSGALRDRLLDPAQIASLRSFGAARGVTLFALLLSAYGILLHRLSGENEFVVGVPSRDPGAGAVVGYFIHLLPVRLKMVRGESFYELALRVRRMLIEGQEHRGFPIGRFMEKLRSADDPGRSFITATFNVDRIGDPPPLIDLETELVRVFQGASRFEMHFNFLEGNAPGIECAYRSHLFDAVTIDRWLRLFAGLLAAVAATPESRVEELSWLSPAERHQVFVEWANGPAASPLRGPAHECFARQAQQTPTAVAVISAGQLYTYAEVERRAQQLAQSLRGLGVGPESRVGLLIERSAELIAAILGTWEAGGAYLPLDPTLPTARLAYMVEDALASSIRPVLVIQRALAARLADLTTRGDFQILFLEDAFDHPGGEAADVLLFPRSEPEHLAYLMYTSGTTGQPKAIQVEHGNLSHGLGAIQEAFGFAAGDRIPCLAPSSFDIFLFEVFGPLLAGGSVDLRDLQPTVDLFSLVRVLEEMTLVNAVPALMRQVTAAVKRRGGAASRIRRAFSGGDSVPSEVLVSMREAFPSAELTILYGPTEGTILAASHAVQSSLPQGWVIGRPLPGYVLRVCGPDGEPVPIGVAGELCLGGAGVTRGYLGRDDLTAAMFVRRDGQRWYRTGDRVRWRTDGLLEFLGRLDQQTKVRGFRVEIGEIESALTGISGVREAAIVVRETAGDRRLMACVVPIDPEIDPAQPETWAPFTTFLASSLREILPEYMMPADWLLLPALPLTAHAKVDRRALAQIPLPDLAVIPATTVPETPLERFATDLWQEVLRGKTIGLDDNFFQLGGDSIHAALLTNLLQDRLGEHVWAVAVFEAPTVRSFCRYLEEHYPSAVARITGSREEPANRLSDPLYAGQLSLPSVSRAARETGEPLPLSFPQQRLWFLDRLGVGGWTYNIPMAVRLRGSLDVAALDAALNEIVRRHEVLRTTFMEMEGEPFQVIHSFGLVSFPLLDLSALGEPKRAQEAGRLGEKMARLNFDLARGPMLRSILVRVGESEHLAFLTMHHIVSDGWSTGILLRELASLYEAFSEGRPSLLPELQIQYADFASWQRQWLTREAMLPSLAYWRKQLDGAHPVLELPRDHSRTQLPSLRGSHQSFGFSTDLAVRLQALSQHHGMTLFMTLLAAFQALLARYSAQNFVTIGTPVAGRNFTQTEGLIGFFVNTLALCTDLSGDPTQSALLARVRKTVLGAYAHQDLPFEMLVEELQPARRLSHSPLFQVMFAFQNLPRESLRLPGLNLEPVARESRSAKFDLTLMVSEVSGSLSGTFEYSADLFQAQTILRMVGHLNALLEGMATDSELRLSEFPLLSEAEQAQVLREWNDTAAEPARSRLVYEMVAAQAERRPEAPALLFEGKTVSYRDLILRAGRLAAFLRSAGVRLEDRVGVCLEPSPEMIVALLGILQAGGTYVPLDPDYPAQRRAWILKDAGVEILLTQERFREMLASHPLRLVCLDSDGPKVLARRKAYSGTTSTSGNAAYLIYTSGSTGMPKAVVANHGGLANFTRTVFEALALGPGDRMLLYSSLVFDASVEPIFPTLASGATLVLHPKIRRLSTHELLSFCAQAGVTILNLPGALWRQWMADVKISRARIEAPIRMYMTGGETVPTSLLRDWADRMEAGIGFHSSYGPTEATVAAIVFRTTSRGSIPGLEEIPLGCLLPNVRVHVLDTHFVPVPTGVTGEIYIGGAGVTRGYLHQPALTAERYMPDPWSPEPGGRLYRTGDLARHLAGGALQFLGRRDDQVKIRGFRVELGEIEMAIRDCPGVRDSAVLLHEDRAGERRLVACLVSEADTKMSPLETLALLRETLPAPLVPSHILPFTELPLTIGGKVDRRELSQKVSELLSSVAPRAIDLPRTPTELRLARLWEELLDVRPVGLRDSFFELGGHSLLAVRLTARVKAQFGLDLPLAALFEEPTIESLARRLEAASGNYSWSPLVCIQPGGTEPPLFCIHPIGGGVLGYRPLAQHLGPSQPVYGLQAPGLELQAGSPHISIEEMASSYLSEIRKVQPCGPYRLAGASFGGMVAFEMAQQLLGEGDTVEILALLDTPLPSGAGKERDFKPAVSAFALAREQARQRGKHLDLKSDELQDLPLEEQLERILGAMRSIGVVGPEIDVPWLLRYLQGLHMRVTAVEKYQAKPYTGRIVLFRPLETDPEALKQVPLERLHLFEEPTLGWSGVAEAGVQVFKVPGYHDTLLIEPNVQELAKVLNSCLSQIYVQ